MNCELAHEWIVTAAYGELPDDKEHELEHHLHDCTNCRKEREQLLAMKVLADALPVAEPSPNLVARSRLRLDEALDALPPMRWYELLARRLRNNMASLQSAPITAGLLLAAGIGAGGLGGYEIALGRAAHAAAEPTITAVAKIEPASAPHAIAQQTAPAEPSLTNVASISSVVRQPGGKLVEVHYNQLVPASVQGSLEDPAIRKLLAMATENASSASVRNDSVGLLAAECRTNHGCETTDVRDALMAALLYDKNPAVREKALKGLEPYVTEDVRVRNAVLEALLNDRDTRVRTQSINLLVPVEADTSVRQVLHSVSTSDNSPQIRNVSRQVLDRVPEMEIQ
jgi:anti-sigma factor RsiW